MKRQQGGKQPAWEGYNDVMVTLPGQKEAMLLG